VGGNMETKAETAKKPPTSVRAKKAPTQKTEGQEAVQEPVQPAIKPQAEQEYDYYRVMSMRSRLGAVMGAIYIILGLAILAMAIVMFTAEIELATAEDSRMMLDVLGGVFAGMAVLFASLGAALLAINSKTTLGIKKYNLSIFSKGYKVDRDLSAITKWSIQRTARQGWWWVLFILTGPIAFFVPPVTIELYFGKQLIMVHASNINKIKMALYNSTGIEPTVAV